MNKDEYLTFVIEAMKKFYIADIDLCSTYLRFGHECYLVQFLFHHRN